MIKFNKPIRQAGIRSLIRSEIIKGLNRPRIIFSFKPMIDTIIQVSERIKELGHSTDALAYCSYLLDIELVKTNYNLLIMKIKMRIRIFEFINRGFLKLWNGG